MDDIIQELKRIIKDLSQELMEVREENEALWFMLEEIKESDKAAKKGMDDHRDEMMLKLISGQGPVGEA